MVETRLDPGQPSPIFKWKKTCLILWAKPTLAFKCVVTPNEAHFSPKFTILCSSLFFISCCFLFIFVGVRSTYLHFFHNLNWLKIHNALRILIWKFLEKLIIFSDMSYFVHSQSWIILAIQIIVVPFLHKISCINVTIVRICITSLWESTWKILSQCPTTNWQSVRSSNLDWGGKKSTRIEVRIELRFRFDN